MSNDEARRTPEGPSTAARGHDVRSRRCAGPAAAVRTPASVITSSLGISAFVIATLAILASPLAAFADETAELKAMLADELRVRIAHEEQLTPAAGGKPPLKGESWTFHAGLARPVVRYSRYLNRPPDFTGNYPALANPDMGLGFDGGPWGYWYRGNALRVLIDGRDVFAAQPATRLEWREAENGYLRLVWDLEQGGRLTCTLVVPADGQVLYARLDLAPGNRPVEKLAIALTCYPGGFGPAYGLPSHRSVSTARQTAEVPRNFAGKEFPKMKVSADESWLFYEDKWTQSGALGLLLVPAEHPAIEVALSNYGIGTTLTFPGDTRQVHLAFHAYAVTNASARSLFVAGADAERSVLQTLAFWPDAGQ